MPTVRYTADGGHYRVGGYGFDPGDEKDVDDDDLVDYLADHEDFEVLGDSARSAPENVEESSADESTADDVGNKEFDAGAFLDRTPVEDVADDIRAGEADANLDAIADEASRVTVQDAIGERRAELEG
jgi:hypothetical protein